MKQVNFYDRVNKENHGGIITDTGDIICGCCGGLIERDTISIKNYKGMNIHAVQDFYEKNNDDTCEIEILQVYDTWVDLTKEITGDDKVKKNSENAD